MPSRLVAELRPHAIEALIERLAGASNVGERRRLGLAFAAEISFRVLGAASGRPRDERIDCSRLSSRRIGEILRELQNASILVDEILELAAA